MQACALDVRPDVRVGLVCPYSLDVPGGVQNHVKDLAQALSARGHLVEVLAPGEGTDDLPPHITTVGKAVPVAYNGSVARLAFGPRVAARTRRWLSDADLDVLHVHEPTTPSVSLLALWASAVPVVATFHTANPRSRAMSAVAAVLGPSLEKISARIAVSEAARETLVRHLGGEPVVIPNGVGCDLFAQAEPRPEWQRPGPTIAFLGRVDEPRKGFDVLLAAFASVLARHPGARLLVAGRGSEDIAGAVPATLTGHVELLGSVSDDDRARLLASADVYVAPQLGGESFGIVLLEAMAAGAPVVASDLPSFRAVLEGGRLGELFEAGSPTGAATAISRVLGDGARREQLKADALHAVRRYDWSRIVLDVEAVYDTVTTPPQRHRSSR